MELPNYRAELNKREVGGVKHMDIYDQLKKYTDFSLGKSNIKCELLLVYQN